MAINFVQTKGVKDASTKRKDVEAILESEGFTFKTSKLDTTKKLWTHAKISYLYIFTTNTYYWIRGWSIENSFYDLPRKQYGNETKLIDILADV